MIELFALPIAGFCDRVRGGYPQGRSKKYKYLCMTLIGPILALQVTTNWQILLGSMLIGHVIFRQDQGFLGRWVRNEKGKWIEAIRWGAIAAIPFCCLIPFEKNFIYAIPAFLIGSPLASLIATKLPETRKLNLWNAWPWSEFIRFQVIGLILCLLASIKPL